MFLASSPPFNCEHIHRECIQLLFVNAICMRIWQLWEISIMYKATRHYTIAFPCFIQSLTHRWPTRLSEDTQPRSPALILILYIHTHVCLLNDAGGHVVWVGGYKRKIHFTHRYDICWTQRCEVDESLPGRLCIQTAPYVSPRLFVIITHFSGSVVAAAHGKY